MQRRLETYHLNHWGALLYSKSSVITLLSHSCLPKPLPRLLIVSGDDPFIVSMVKICHGLPALSADTFSLYAAITLLWPHQLTKLAVAGQAMGAALMLSALLANKMAAHCC